MTSMEKVVKLKGEIKRLVGVMLTGWKIKRG